MDFRVIVKDHRTNEVTLDPVLTPEGTEVPRLPGKIFGTTELFQIVYLSLMNNPGRNIQYPTMGSGLPGMIGQYNISASSTSEIFAVLVGRIEKVKVEILENQASLRNAPRSSLLSDLFVLGVESGDTIDTVRIRFRMISQDGTVEDFVI